MSQPAALVTVVYEDSNGMRTQRQYEAKSAAISDNDALALANDSQPTTQLSVVDVLVSRRITGFNSTPAEQNSSVAETASLRCRLGQGGFHTLNLPALKAPLKSGKSVNTNDPLLVAFLSHFDNGDGAGGTQGNFFVSDGEELSEAYIEAGKVEGKVNR